MATFLSSRQAPWRAREGIKESGYINVNKCIYINVICVNRCTLQNMYIYTYIYVLHVYIFTYLYTHGAFANEISPTGTAIKELKLLDTPIASGTFYEDMLLGILYSMIFCQTIVQVTSSYTILKVSPVFSRQLFS